MDGLVTIREFVHKMGFAVSLDGLNAYEKTVDRLNTKVEKMFSGADRLVEGLEKSGKKMTIALSAPIGIISGFSLKARAKLDSERRQWGAMLGGLSEGSGMVNRLRVLAGNVQMNDETVNQYALSLRRLQVPMREIIPIIQKFSDIAAGTGQDAGFLMESYVQAKNVKGLRGRLLMTLARQGVITDADMKRFGLDPRTIRKEGGRGNISDKVFEDIFNSLYSKNAGKSKIITEGLAKGFDEFGDSVKYVRESIGGLIEKTFKLNTLLRVSGAVITVAAYKIEHLSPVMRTIVAVAGGILFIAGPTLLFLGKFAAAIFFIGKAASMLGLFTGISMAPLIAQIVAVTAALGVVLFVAKEVYDTIQRIRGLDKDSKVQASFQKAGGSMQQWRATPKTAAASDNTFVSPNLALSYASGKPASKEAMAGLFGGGGTFTPVSVTIENNVTLGHGTRAETTAAVKQALQESSEAAARHLTRQIQAAKKF